MKPLVLVTMGDSNGIGPEVALKAVASPAVRHICIPVLVGSIDVFEFYARLMKRRILLRELENLHHVENGRTQGAWVLPVARFEKPRLTPGQPSVEAGRLAGEAIRVAARLCLSGKAEAVVTAPVSKKQLVAAGHRFPGQTEMFAALCRASSVAMMLVAEPLRVALTTTHRPLKDVHRSMTKKKILETIGLVHTSLKRDFNIRRPVVAVLGLNPHAGENGMLGSEERTGIVPAIREARSKRMAVEGPFAADGFFGTRAYEAYDAVLAMYHDQGLVPLKILGFWRGVNFSAGLPIVRTSPDHGTAFDIAGKGVANPSSMIEAIRLAVNIANNRRRRTGQPTARTRPHVMRTYSQ